MVSAADMQSRPFALFDPIASTPGLALYRCLEPILVGRRGAYGDVVHTSLVLPLAAEEGATLRDSGKSIKRCSTVPT